MFLVRYNPVRYSTGQHGHVRLGQMGSHLRGRPLWAAWDHCPSPLVTLSPTMSRPHRVPHRGLVLAYYGVIRHPDVDIPARYGRFVTFGTFGQ